MYMWLNHIGTKERGFICINTQTVRCRNRLLPPWYDDAQLSFLKLRFAFFVHVKRSSFTGVIK